MDAQKRSSKMTARAPMTRPPSVISAEVVEVKSKALTSKQQSRLGELEEKIGEGMRSFVDVGEALLEIRDSKLYRTEFRTFEAYCQDRWGMGKRNANYLIGSAEVVSNLGTMVPVLPATERQARPLTALPPADQQEAWSEVLEAAGDEPVTAKLVTKVVNKLRPKKAKTKKRVKGTCLDAVRCFDALEEIGLILDSLSGLKVNREACSYISKLFQDLEKRLDKVHRGLL